ncbi:MAG TPA: right-handed parallel beta-helix repeat-containing protein [Allosphingosinicella sp.]|nr:right-handed parallel beta-helix repeat-containing protein [Allosphingosinicella sp.]
MIMLRRAMLAVAAFSPLLVPAVAQAQATRTWVSGVGDDVNPCSRTAPCKTFAGAISKTAAGGEINCLDPGGFGAVTITKSITIDCAGTLGSILAASSNGIVINGANVVVVLRNLTLNAPANGLVGIRLVNGARLEITNVTVSGFAAATSAGISIDSAISTVLIRDSIVSGNRVGLRVQPTNNAQVTVTGSAFVGNITTGISALGGGSRVRVADSTLFANGLALTVGASAQILSYGNNLLDGNTAESAFTGSVLPR